MLNKPVFSMLATLASMLNKPVFSMLAILASTTAAHASSHWAIVADPPNTKTDTAFLDIGTDQAPNFTYGAFPCVSATSCIATAPFDLDNQFGSSPDLFKLTGASAPFLVFANLADGQSPPQPVAAPSTAMLRLDNQVMVVPPVEKAAGTQFAFPLADLGQGAILLIGNPGTNANDCDVVVTPTPLTPPQTITIPLAGARAVSLTRAGTRVTISSPSGVPVIVQLLIIGKGKEFSMTMLPPLN